MCVSRINKNLCFYKLCVGQLKTLLNRKMHNCKIILRHIYICILLVYSLDNKFPSLRIC